MRHGSYERAGRHTYPLCKHRNPGAAACVGDPKYRKDFMMSGSRKIRYAVVGTGQISQQAFIPGIAAIENSELVALVTGDPDKAKALHDRYGVRCYPYDEFSKLLASGTVDAVYMATPNTKHRDLTVLALKAGIHVLLEKPMTANIEDAEAIVAAQKASRAKLMIAYRLHHEPGTVEMINKVRDGAIGDVTAFSSVFSQSIDENNHRGHSGYWSGPVPDMGTYPLNAVRNLFGEEPIEVTAVGIRTPGRHFNFEDTVSVTLKFPKARVANFTVSYASAAVETLTVLGNKGYLQASPCFGFGPDTGISYSIETGEGGRTFKHPPTNQFGGEISYFSECILNGQDPEADGEEGLRDVRVLAAIEQALLTGQTQTIPRQSPKAALSFDQIRAFPPVDQPDDHELIGVVSQSK